ncbi:MAG: type I glyceraldehyde-3-phosphate dehydrogenase [bacterium]|nr:type I glyceraldehyde-3-phosphate dehydrogenase [bacterium]
MAVRVGIMGFGRIGRNLFRQAHQREDIDIVAISDLGTPESMAYLVEYDTIYGHFPNEVRLNGKYLESGRQRARLLKGVRPEDMPWDAYEVDVVVDSTGVYRSRAELQGHLDSGCSRVILTTPAIDEIDRTIIHGVNSDALVSNDQIVSCASATTHALGLILKVLDEAIGVERAMMTTVHAYTNDQNLSDSVTPHLRRSRSAAENLIPNWTWSPNVLEGIMPSFKGKVDGMAVNVPVANGSNLDLSCMMRKTVSVEEINNIIREAAANELAPYLAYCDDPVVSSDVIGNPHSAVFDSLATLALDGGLIKTVTWYDNGWGYAARILDTTITMGGFLGKEEG